MYNKIILGIDTSCDDTAIGIIQIINNKISILSNKREDQEEISYKYGGIVPEISSRNHTEKIDKILQECLRESLLNINDINIISSTIGPGLLGSIIVGSTFGIGLSSLWNKTFIPIHHIEAHMLVAQPNFPCLCCIISGGHTLIIKAESFGKYEIICSTLDDACGEVFDKLGRKMNLPFPSGKYIEEKAKLATHFHKLFIPMKNQLQFSFSGLKTSFSNLDLNDNDLCYCIQETISDTLYEKLKLAIEKTNIDNIIICGGVASNKSIRQNLSKLSNNVYFPPIELCTDNGVMIAIAAYYHDLHKTKLVNNIEISEFPRMNLEDWCKLF